LAHSVTSALGVAVPRLAVLPHPIGGFDQTQLIDRGVPDLAIRLVDQLIETSGHGEDE
jgi:hypothetical protein